MIKILTALLLTMGTISVQADVVEIISPEQHVALIESGKPMIIMFGADWCGFCREAKPEFIKAEKLYKGKVIFAYIDTDKVRVPFVNGIPEFVIGSDINNLVLLESLGQLPSRDVKGIIEYIKRFTGVSP